MTSWHEAWGVVVQWARRGPRKQQHLTTHTHVFGRRCAPCGVKGKPCGRTLLRIPVEQVGSGASPLCPVVNTARPGPAPTPAPTASNELAEGGCTPQCPPVCPNEVGDTDPLTVTPAISSRVTIRESPT